MRLPVVLIGLMWAAICQASDSSVASFICGDITEYSERQQCLEKAAVVTKAPETMPLTTPSSWLGLIWPMGWWIAYYGFGLIIGLYIYRDARKRVWLFLRIRPAWWGLLALFDPAFGLLVYWVTHYSRLSQNYSEAAASNAATPMLP